MYTAAPVTPELPEPQESKAGNQKNRKTQLINSLRLKYEKKKNYLTSRTVMKIVVNVPDKVGALIIEGKVFPFISSHLDPSNLIPSPHFSSLLSSLSSLLSSPLFSSLLSSLLSSPLSSPLRSPLLNKSSPSNWQLVTTRVPSPEKEIADPLLLPLNWHSSNRKVSPYHNKQATNISIVA